MFGIVTTVVLLLAAFSGFMYVNQPGMIFFPIQELRDAPSNWGLQFEEINFQTSDKLELHAWYIPRQGAEKTLLFFHGNAGNISHRGDSVKLFHDLGLNVLIFDYRGYGRSQGEPDEQGLYEDGRAAWRYLTQSRGVQPASIILFGRSLGGAVAAKLAAEVNAAGLILESTFSSGKDMARSLFPLLSYIIYVRFDFDTASVLKGVDYPVMVIHSPEDNIIPYDLGQKVYKSANQPKQFVSIQGDHNSGFLQSGDQYKSAIREFIAEMRG